MSNPTRVATVRSAALLGFAGYPVEVETDIKAGLPALQVVGMGNKAVDEARQRVRSAITNSHLEFPARKVVVNLAPAELPKDGTHYDLPIALSILVASGQLKQSEVDGSAFAGEVALNGSIRPIRGAISIAESAIASGIHRLYLPVENAQQAAILPNIRIVPVDTLYMVYQLLKGVRPLPPTPTLTSDMPDESIDTTSLDTIEGHQAAKRALAIAVAGRHNLLFSGSPGSGKTLLCKAVPSLLPALTPSESLEVTKLHSLTGVSSSIISTPPLRAPHHGVTASALVGGGLHPRPGDISLAHKGVLFLDELPEYPRATLELLRQPLEDRSITLSRLYGYITYPADFMLIATMNPCPCGYYGSSLRECTCTGHQLNSYQKKISGPLRDRIDIHLSVSPISHEHFLSTKTLKENQHSEVKKLVLTARIVQKKRYKRSNYYNAYATLDDIRTLFNVTPEAEKLIKGASKKLQLSTRAYVKTLRVARTIADLEAAPNIEIAHVAEALQYRSG